MFEIIPNKININFVGKRKFFLGLSVVALILTGIGLFTKGLNYGIDFTGGGEVQLQFSLPYTSEKLRSVLSAHGFENLKIQQLGEERANEYLVKFQGDEKDLQQVSPRLEKALTSPESGISKEQYEVKRVDVVGPQAGDELRKSGFLSIFYTLLCILLYVAIRFDYRYGPGAVLALIHDSALTVGIFIILQKEFSLQTLAAILTIIGYSNNDTIIVYDRVRETVKAFPNRSLVENINRSINETLSRTILTSVCTLMVVSSLIIFGGGVIHDFAFTMFIGIIVGTYSSIFIASPILIFITEWNEKRGKKTFRKPNEIRA